MAKSQENSTNSTVSLVPDRAREARLVVRQACTGSLATQDADSGYPFASLVTVASSAAGDPILLLSGLARHSKNIQAQRKVSLMVEEHLGAGDPLAKARVTLLGKIEVTNAPEARARFLARHPEAHGYADFADFSFYRLSVESAHFIAGFGRIQTFPRSEVCLDGVEGSLIHDVDLLAACTRQHQDTLQAIWNLQTDTPSREPLEVVGCDGDGLDVRSGERVRRINYRTVLKTIDALPAELAAVLVALDGSETSATDT